MAVKSSTATVRSSSPPSSPNTTSVLAASSEEISGFNLDLDSNFDLGVALLAASNEPSLEPNTYKARFDSVNFTMWGGPTVTPKTVLGFCLTGSKGTAKMRRTFNLNEVGGVFKQQHDLPRRVGKNGKMEMEFDWADQGWYFTKGETNVLKAMKQMKEMVDAEVFMGCKFTWKTVRLPEERAIQLLRALRFREGLNNYVDLTQEGTCLVAPNEEKTFKRKRCLKLED